MQIQHSSVDKCPFPGCNLREHDEGDHDFCRPNRPVGEIRKTQIFRTDIVTCDLEKDGRLHAPARAFFVDALGFGWALCGRCARRFGQ